MSGSIRGLNETGSMDLLFGVLGADFAVRLPFRAVDGKASATRTRFEKHRAPDLVRDASGRALILYGQTRTGRAGSRLLQASKIVQVTADGVVTAGPAAIGAIRTSSERLALALAVNKSRTRAAAVFGRSGSPSSVLLRVIDPLSPPMELAAATRITTVTRTALVQKTDGSIVFSLPGGSVTGTVTADALLETGGFGVPPAGLRRIATARVRPKTGGAAFGGTATVTFRVPPRFTGGLGALSLQQADASGNFVELPNVTRDPCTRTLSTTVTDISRTIGLLEPEPPVPGLPVVVVVSGDGGCTFGGDPLAALPWAAFVAGLALLRGRRRRAG